MKERVSEGQQSVCNMAPHGQNCLPACLFCAKHLGLSKQA